jgi:hypothetical protein
MFLFCRCWFSGFVDSYVDTKVSVKYCLHLQGWIVSTYDSARRYNPENLHRHFHHCEIFVSYWFYYFVCISFGRFHRSIGIISQWNDWSSVASQFATSTWSCNVLETWPVFLLIAVLPCPRHSLLHSSEIDRIIVTSCFDLCREAVWF